MSGRSVGKAHILREQDEIILWYQGKKTLCTTVTAAEVTRLGAPISARETIYPTTLGSRRINLLYTVRNRLEVS